jgi:hypothetical protein
MKTSIYLLFFCGILSTAALKQATAQSIPTKIFLDKQTVEDGTPANTPIATISTDLPDLDDTFIFEILPYLNDPVEYPDYEYFKIIGRTLYTAREIFSPEWDWPDFFFVIRVSNTEDESFSAEFIIVIEYVNVAPKITELTSNSVPEKLEFDFLNPAFTIGEIVITDPNPDDTHIVSIVDDGPESALFTVVKSVDPGTLAETFLLQTSHTFIYAEKNQYTLQFIACESEAEGLCSEPTSFDIFITTNEPQPPSGIIATTLSTTSIELNWTNPDGNLQEIEIERSSTPDEGFELVHTIADQSEAWIDEGLNGGTIYYYRLRSKIDDEFSGYSAVLSATTDEEPVVVPEPVQNLTAAAISSTAIELQWNPVEDADQIILQRSLSGGEDDFTNLATLGGDAISFTDIELSPATQYFYRARVILNGQESEFSEIVSATTEEEPVVVPEPVQNLTAAAVSSTAIELQWNPVEDADQIILQRSLSEGEDDFTNLATLGGDAISFTDTELSPATQYFYRVRVILNGQESEFSEIVSATTEEEPVVVPEPVQNLTAAAISSTAIELQWNPVEDADQIILQRSLSEVEGDFTNLATLGGDAISFTDTELSPATQYFYRARVILNGQESEFSEIVSGLTFDDVEMVLIKGQIFNPLGQAVKEVEIQVEGEATFQTITDESGNFQFNYPKNASFRVIPSKSLEARPNNGVSTLDIILVGRHILNLRPIDDPYLLLAADVNKDNNITAIDQVMMRNVLLGKTKAFINQQLWRFMPASHDLSASMTFDPFIEEIAGNGKNIDFTGIRLGDVNNSWNINAARTGTSGTLVLELKNPEFTENEVLIPVYAKNFAAIAGFQFSLDWNPADLQLFATKNASLKVHFHRPNNQNGNMSISFDDPELSGRNVAEDEVLFYLVAQKNSNTGLNLSSLKVSTYLMEVMAFDADLNLLNIEINQHIQSLAAGYTLFQNHPNPVQDISHFVYETEEEGLATITIIDGVGRIVDKLEQQASRGQNSLIWNKHQSSVVIRPGVYLYKLEINGFQAVRRMSIQ